MNKKRNKKNWNKDIIFYNPLPLEKMNLFIKWINQCNIELQLGLTDQDVYNIYIYNIGNIENIYHHNIFKIILNYINDYQ